MCRSIFCILAFYLILNRVEPINGQTAIRSDTNFSLPRSIPKIVEKLHIHSDRSIYVAGENILFKAYYTNNLSDSKLMLSKVLYVDIVGNNGNIIAKHKFILENNTAFGTIEIPQDTKSAYYTMCAYTNWQKNFGSDYFAKKELTIINNKRNVIIQDPNDNKTKKIEFFPEGGEILYDQKNLIAFKSFNKYGNPTITKGKIIDNNGNYICELKNSKQGIGFFELLPEKNKKYKAVIYNKDSTTQVYPLPNPVIKAIKINVDNLDKRFVYINIESLNATSSNFKFKIEITSSGHKIKVIEDSLYRGKFFTKIPSFDLQNGLNQIAIYDENDSKIYEKLLYIPSINKLNLKLNTDKNKYGRREKVICKIKAFDIGNNNLKTNFSVSVVKKATKRHSLSLDFFEEHKLSSYFESAQLIDTYLLTQSLNDNKEKETYFLPEIRGLSIRGTISSKTNKLPIPNRAVHLSVLGNSTLIQNAVSDKNGRFVFSFENFFGIKDIVLQLSDTKIDDYVISVDKEYNASTSNAREGGIIATDKDKRVFEDLVKSYQISQRFKESSQIYKENPENFSFYGKPDRVYVLENYVQMPTMEELLNEIVDEIIVTEKKDNARIVISRKKNNPLLLKPLILIDGLPIFNHSAFLEINPSEISQIELIKTDYYIGNVVFGGIINLSSKRKNFASFKIPKSAKFLEISMFSKSISFVNKSSDLKNISSRKPDYRNTLYWNPNKVTDEDGKAEFSFYTSDEPGDYEINIEGLSSRKLFGSSTVNFSVE